MDFIYKSGLEEKHYNINYIFCRYVYRKHYKPQVITLLRCNGSYIFFKDLNDEDKSVKSFFVDPSVFVELEPNWDKTIVNCYLDLHNKLFDFDDVYHLTGIKGLYSFISSVMSKDTNGVVSFMRQYDTSSDKVNEIIKQLGLAYKNIDPILHDYFLNLFHSNRYALSTVSPH